MEAMQYRVFIYPYRESEGNNPESPAHCSPDFQGDECRFPVYCPQPCDPGPRHGQENMEVRAGTLHPPGMLPQNTGYQFPQISMYSSCFAISGSNHQVFYSILNVNVLEACSLVAGPLNTFPHVSSPAVTAVTMRYKYVGSGHYVHESLAHNRTWIINNRSA
ncbi:hypothetical protein KI387_009645, partial [Taxus chinensis]